MDRERKSSPVCTDGESQYMKLSVGTVGTEVAPAMNEEAGWQGDQSQSPSPKGTPIGKLQEEETAIAPAMGLSYKIFCSESVR